MIEFDIRGNIKQGEIKELSLNEFEYFFVNEFPNNLIRQSIFQLFRKLIDSLLTKLNSDFSILIDGSFTSQKKEPNDMDMVFILPSSIWDNEQNLSILKNEFYTFRNKRVKILDFYFIPDFSYSEDQKYKEIYLYWVEFFSKTKPDNEGNVYSKGLVKINIKRNG